MQFKICSCTKTFSRDVVIFLILANNEELVLDDNYNILTNATTTRMNPAGECGLEKASKLKAINYSSIGNVQLSKLMYSLTPNAFSLSTIWKRFSIINYTVNGNFSGLNISSQREDVVNEQHLLP